MVVAESFGPLAPILPVRDLDDAIAVANATAYGLSSGPVDFSSRLSEPRLPTRWQGNWVLRLAFVNPATRPDEVVAALDTLAEP